jgi:hypothetical protein
MVYYGIKGGNDMSSIVSNQMLTDFGIPLDTPEDKRDLLFHNALKNSVLKLKVHQVKPMKKKYILFTSEKPVIITQEQFQSLFLERYNLEIRLHDTVLHFNLFNK